LKNLHHDLHPFLNKKAERQYSITFQLFISREDSSIYGRYARLGRLDKNNQDEMLFRLTTA
jgi:hypothetical protein